MYLTGDLRGGTVMMAMVVLGVGLRFVQEAKADTAAAKLKAMIRVTATVLRDGIAQEVPLGEVVPGDIVRLAAGDMIPGDLRLLVSKDLFVAQASLTGESLPVEKSDVPTSGGIAKTPLELPDLCFMGTSVESGSATAVVAFLVLVYFGQPRAGLALGIGLALGGLNGLLASRSVDAAGSFRLLRLMRIGLLSTAALAVGLLLQPETAWVAVAGVALSQFVMSAIALRSVLRT